MRFSTSPIIGTIAIEPSGAACLNADADDSSLEAMLASLVRGPSLASPYDRPVCFTSNCRFGRFGLLEAGEGGAAQADLTRLLDDLAAEYDRLAVA